MSPSLTSKKIVSSGLDRSTGAPILYANIPILNVKDDTKQLNIENPVIIVPMEFQHLVSALLSNYLNNISVITHEEIGCNYRIETLAEI